ncbi:tetratricopeptide repeat protein [Blastomonas sp.]|uniref:tetratricopeptide repeat protein n=1 Tax=Blastomonas sp. TaxID=1909299 RepID=UPI00391C439D
MALPPGPAQQIIPRAMAHLRGGNAAAARLEWYALPPADQAHPDCLFVRALIDRAGGRLTEAGQALAAAIEAEPMVPQIWKLYAEVLDDLGNTMEALRAVDRAAAIAPGYIDAWHDMAVLALKTGQPDLAEQALVNLANLKPDDARLTPLHAALAQARGDHDAAVAGFQQVLAAKSNDRRALHNLAVSLREIDRREEALAAVDEAIRHRIDNPASFTLRAHLLAELGHYEAAVDQYRDVIARHPDFLDAHETLARLMPQLGGGEPVALNGYRAALADRPGSKPLWLSAIASAKALGKPDQMREWADAALQRFGATPDMKMLRASADIAAGDWDAARPRLEELASAHPESHSARLNLAHVLLAQGDAKGAETHALAASELNRDDQSAWALLTVIWRLLNDPREHWLADYERFVMPVDLAAPVEWSSMAAFLADLRPALEALHTTQMHPAEQTLRGGTQTRGILFNRRDAAIQGLASSIRAAVNAALGGLAFDMDHPFLRRMTDDIAFAGSWSVRLASEGFHVSHVHASGWLSSACYIALPPEVANGSDTSGALQFGSPDSAFGLDLAPRRIIAPAEGRLVIFPSYLWHGTLPFESNAHRLTVAFDALPLASRQDTNILV